MNIVSWIPNVLLRLLGRTKAKIHSEKDSQILYNKIIHVFNKLYSQFPHGTYLKDLLDKFTNDLEDAKPSSLIEKLDVDINLIDDLKQVMENFKNQFLSETEEKAKKPHEKSG